MTGADARGRLLLVALAVFVVALATRTGPLYWSPLPTTPEGVRYAALAADAIDQGTLSLARLGADEVAVTTVLAAVGLVVDDRPLTLAQPVVAVTGAAICVTAMALVRRLSRRAGWGRARVVLAVGVAGALLAVDGLAVRASGTTTTTVLALLVVPLLALAYHRTVTATARPFAWGLSTAILALSLPLVDALGAVVGALAVTALASALVVRLPLRRRLVAGLALTGGVWLSLAAHSSLATRATVLAPDMTRFTAYPGLVLAWLIVVVVGTWWLQHTSRRLQRLAVALPLLGWFGLVVLNRTTAVFPGMQQTPPSLLPVLAAVLVPVATAVVGLPVVTRDRAKNGPVVVALLLAGMAVVSFSLTATLTPPYFETAVRGQAFVHLPVAVAAGLGVGVLVRSVQPWPARRRGGSSTTDGTRSATSGVGPVLRRGAAVALVCLVLGSAVLTAPLAYTHLDTMATPATTSQSEFAGATFAATHVEGSWGTDAPLARVATAARPTANVSTDPVAAWAANGSAPRCPTFTRHSWATSGAHLTPSPAATVDAARFTRWRADNDVVYAAGGRDPVTLVVPRTPMAGC